jgi:hypothetical protein
METLQLCTAVIAVFKEGIKRYEIFLLLRQIVMVE